MPSAIMREVLQLIEAEVQSRPTPFEFELAYQARVAIDRIRFAIQHIEKFVPHTDQMREASLQLLDALDRLDCAERRFQWRFRRVTANGNTQKVELVQTGSKPRANAGGRS